jgi:hypothetical protein
MFNRKQTDVVGEGAGVGAANSSAATVGRHSTYTTDFKVCHIIKQKILPEGICNSILKLYQYLITFYTFLITAQQSPLSQQS